MANLATKYRPQTFDDVCSQKAIIKILKKQIETKKYTNVYLFSGPTGCGKTTIARIFANEINNHEGTPIEIDAASNNGVENVRNIISSAKERSLDSEYKIYIIDEVHMLTLAAWNALLKTLEEPPKYTIFMMCTTDAQKIPATILNRTMRFNITKIPTSEIKNRLMYICGQEGFTNYEESCDYISKLSCGGCRDAISLLEKCGEYSTDLTINNVLATLGNFSYESMFNLTNAIIDGDESTIIKILESYYLSGNDLKIFVEQYLDFVLDLTKYCLFKSMNSTKLPTTLEKILQYTTGIENGSSYFGRLADSVLELKNKLKYDTSCKSTIEVSFLKFSRGN